ncbi:hypothetical protein GGH94_001865 [Coemansia aciculifera]|uniref:C2 NT-type domain-containing protein n=1 Tax=Coemansia aciculifera TaxID=417176 RepID=A0A9W8M789_9FUNG|nr:hypothetical protein GGH94_001865 [Coemansia aciculifera]KAJ2874482.1 hypothetical protein GGH93_002394 [Coemansia aciculifera]
MAIHNLFVPRARLATFNVQLRIEDLNNVPPLNGLFYVKWRLQDYSGSTPRAPVVNREVRWSQAVEKSADISIAKEGVLAPCELKISIKQLSICVSQSGGPDSYDVPPLDRSMVLTDLNDMITNENNARGGRENSSMGNSFSSKQHSAAHNYRKPANSATSVHTNTTRSNTTETSQSRALLPIDNTNVRELAPFQRSSKKNQQIIDDVFFSPPTLPS